MKIKFTKQAIIERDQNIQYLLDEWNISVASQFLDEIDERIELLEKGILEGNYDTDLGMYRILIVSQITMHFVVENQTIFITNFWNNYKKPLWL
ncbi:TPA: hypothetical protein EYP45_02700 [Candidatus Peregrinibacteria bacterium]|nr:hypothetical protein [Candidatus Peregrinibacteria bacterium]